MLKGIDVNQRVEFSSKEDSDPKTVFVLKPLSGADMIDLADFSNGGDLKLSGKGIIDFLDKAVVEVKNYEGATDKREILESLTASVLTEVVNAVAEMNNITDSDKKK